MIRMATNLCFALILTALIASAVSLPFAVEAQGASKGLVPCGNTLGADGKVADPCTFRHFLVGISNVVNYMILLGTVLAALAFAYAGFLYMSAAGNPGKIGKAHGIFWNVFIGLVVMLSAWLIVSFIVTSLVPKEKLKDYSKLQSVQ